MRDKIDRGAPIVMGCVIVACVLGGLVWGTFGRNHTKVVTKTVTTTKYVTKNVTKPWDGTAQGMADIVHPTTGGSIKCPAGAPKNAACFQLGGPKFYMLLVVPK